jgi:hypothetical protein
VVVREGLDEIERTPLGMFSLTSSALANNAGLPFITRHPATQSSSPTSLMETKIAIRLGPVD